MILLFGCTSYKGSKFPTKPAPKQPFPLSGELYGKDIEEIKGIINEEEFYVWMFNLPDQRDSPLTILIYLLSLPDCGNNCWGESFWLLFNQNNEFIFFEMVNSNYNSDKEIAIDAEYRISTAYLKKLLQNKKITHAYEARQTFNKYKELFGSDNYTDELFLYKIMLAEKVDKGAIDLAESEYLVAEKTSNIKERIESAQYQSDQIEVLNWQAELQRSANNLQLFQAYSQERNNRRNRNIPSISMPRINCRSINFGTITDTTCW